MVVNKATGERYSESHLGASTVLVSSTSGIRRIVGSFDKQLFIRRKGDCTIKVRKSETDLIQDLVRSLYLETKYLELHGQKIFVSF